MQAIDTIKQLCSAGDLVAANEALRQLMSTEEFRMVANQKLKKPSTFYEQQIDAFVMTLIDDLEDTADKAESKFEAIIGQSFFMRYVNTYNDILVHLFHVASHNMCAELWKSCRMLMHTLEQTVVFMIEELYNQRLVHLVAPDVHNGFVVCSEQYDQLKCRRSVERTEWQTLFSLEPKHSNNDLNALHRWLYANDPLLPQTFDKFVVLFTRAMQDTALLDQVRRY